MLTDQPLGECRQLPLCKPGCASELKQGNSGDLPELGTLHDCIPGAHLLTTPFAFSYFPLPVSASYFSASSSSLAVHAA